MAGAIQKAWRAVSRRRGGDAAATDGPPLQRVKTDLIDDAFSEHRVRSFADLGGVWAVEAGYTFYALTTHEVDRAVLVDTGITPDVRERSRRFPQLELVQGNFGDQSSAQAVGSVDAVFLFDVLLHQVNPDWDAIIDMYASRCRCFLIVNPQYNRSDDTVRLVDLPAHEYLSVVPAVPIHEEALARLDEIHPTYDRPYRDIHEIWQWGIVDRDIDAVLASHGFRCVKRQNHGPWFGLQDFDNVSMIFVRDEPT